MITTGWIRIEDALPRKHGTVIVCAPGNDTFTSDRFPAFYNLNDDGMPKGFASALPEKVVSQITHWMPLPDSPAVADAGFKTAVIDTIYENVRDNGKLADLIRAVVEHVTA